MDDTTFLLELSRVEGKLMSFAMTLTGHCIDDAQELFQATVVRAYMKRALFTPGTRFGFWIERIMRNVYLNESVAARRRAAFCEEVCYAYVDSVFTDNRLEFNEVCTLIERLPSEVALPLRMYSQGYKYNEIADALNLPMSSVKNRIRAARIYLKRVLDE